LFVDRDGRRTGGGKKVVVALMLVLLSDDGAAMHMQGGVGDDGPTSTAAVELPSWCRVRDPGRRPGTLTAHCSYDSFSSLLPASMYST
jgi:hypothetical protein